MQYMSQNMDARPEGISKRGNGSHCDQCFRFSSPCEKRNYMMVMIKVGKMEQWACAKKWGQKGLEKWGDKRAGEEGLEAG